MFRKIKQNIIMVIPDLKKKNYIKNFQSIVHRHYDSESLGKQGM